MTTKRVFVIKNQNNQYLDKHSGWLSGKDAQLLFRVDHHDQALNTLLEINSKDISLRGRILEVDTDEKKNPVVEVCEDAIAMDKTTTIIEETANTELVEDDEPEEEAIEIIAAEETFDELDD
jgi:hypothetical protein